MAHATDPNDAIDSALCAGMRDPRERAALFRLEHWYQEFCASASTWMEVGGAYNRSVFGVPDPAKNTTALSDTNTTALSDTNNNSGAVTKRPFIGSSSIAWPIASTFAANRKIPISFGCGDVPKPEYSRSFCKN